MSVKHGNLIYHVSSANILSHNTLKGKQYKATNDFLYGDKESQYLIAKNVTQMSFKIVLPTKFVQYLMPKFCKQI